MADENEKIVIKIESEADTSGFKEMEKAAAISAENIAKMMATTLSSKTLTSQEIAKKVGNLNSIATLQRRLTKVGGDNQAQDFLKTAFLSDDLRTQASWVTAASKRIQGLEGIDKERQTADKALKRDNADTIRLKESYAKDTQKQDADAIRLRAMYAKEAAKAAAEEAKEYQEIHKMLVADRVEMERQEKLADDERRANAIRDAKAAFGELIETEKRHEETEKRAAAAAKKHAKEVEKATKEAASAEYAAMQREAKEIAAQQAKDAKEKAKAEADAAKEAEKAAKAAAKEAAERQKLLKSFGSKIKDRLTAPFKGVADGISRSVAMVKRAFTRIILYKGIRQAMSTIFNSFKTGFENLYQYSAAFSTQFKKSMDSLATDALYVKNSLGAMAEPLVNRIAPAVDMLTDKFVALLNTINQVIATLSGESSYRRAIKYPTEYAEAAKGAAKANQLWLGSFDEINRMTENKGGGSAEELDYSKMFEEAPVQGFIQDIIDNNRWEAAGAAIANKLNEMVSSVDTHSMGAKLGEKIRGAVDFSLSFLKTFSFSGAGQKIADWINGAVEEVDWNDVGDLMVTGFTSAIDFFGGLLGGIEHDKVATAISDWLKGAIDSATSWLKDKDWEKATENAYNAVKGFLTNIDWDGIWTSVWELSKTAAIAAFHILATGIRELIDDMVRVADMKIQEIADLFEIDLPPIFTKTWETIKAGFEEFKKFVDECGILQAIKKQFDFNPLGGAFGDFLRMLFPSGTSGFSGSGRGSNQKNTVPAITRASGGTVDRGQLFIANERGPELVGQVGHKTTVTNQDQFTRGLEDANAPVVQAVLSAANALIEAVNAKNLTVEIDKTKVSKELYPSMSDEGMRRGPSLAWGR